MRVATLIILVVGLTAGVSGCGDDGAGGEGTDETGAYGARLDAACLELQEELNALPSRVQSGELAVGEVAELGEAAEQRFIAVIEELEPPAPLAAQREQLLGVLRTRGPEDDLGAAAEALGDLTALYADLGAGECERLNAEALARLEGARDPAAPGS